MSKTLGEYLYTISYRDEEHNISYEELGHLLDTGDPFEKFKLIMLITLGVVIVEGYVDYKPLLFKLTEEIASMCHTIMIDEDLKYVYPNHEFIVKNIVAYIIKILCDTENITPVNGDMHNYMLFSTICTEYKINIKGDEPSYEIEP